MQTVLCPLLELSDPSRAPTIPVRLLHNEFPTISWQLLSLKSSVSFTECVHSVGCKWDGLDSPLGLALFERELLFHWVCL